MLKAESSSLKAGPTGLKSSSKPLQGGILRSNPTNMKSKMAGGSTRLGGVGYLKKKDNKSKMKTTTSDKDNEVVWHDNQVANPKKLITEKFKETEKTYKAQVQQEQAAKVTKTTVKGSTSLMESSMRTSPLQSMDKSSSSDIKNSSSNLQERSSFLESKKSENTELSEEEKKEKEKDSKKKKKGKKNLTENDLNEDVPINISETGTLDLLFIPSSLVSNDNPIHAAVLEMNKRYTKLVEDKKGSDNFTQRATQTFNYQSKQKEQQSSRIEKYDGGCFASIWDLYDASLQDPLSDYEILQAEIKKNIDKELCENLKNPFCVLSTEFKALMIHVKQEVPGALEAQQKENKDKTGRTLKGTANMGSGVGGCYTLSGVDREESIRESSSTNSKLMRNPTKKQHGVDQSQVSKVSKGNFGELNESDVLNDAINESKNAQKQADIKQLNIDRLLLAFKHIDRILNQNSYHKEIISYRNYPEINTREKTIQDEDQSKRFAFKGLGRSAINRDIKEEDNEKEEQKEQQAINFLFKYKCDLTQNRTVSSADWNYINKDLLAISYGEYDLNSNREGYVMFWTLKNPSFPERIIKYPSRITSCKFSESTPNLLAIGTIDGVVAIYDIRKNYNKPIAENKQMNGKHGDAVWEVNWVNRGGKGDKGEALVSISSDGRIVEWSMKKGLEFTDLMNLKRHPNPSQKESNVSEGTNFRQAGGFSFDFIRGEPSMYLAATDEGTVHRCSKSYAEQYLESYYGHDGPVYKVRSNPFWSDIFLTCSADWSSKLWNWREENYKYSFKSLDLFDEVLDIEWNPNCSTLFASVCKDGRLELWDLSKNNMLDPFAFDKPKEALLSPKTMVRFCAGAPIVITGDMAGDTNIYRLHGYEDCDPKRQQERLMKILYPGGYNKVNREGDEFMV